MTKIQTGATMSLDGYIAGPDESGFDRLFQWYGNGDVEVPTTHDDMTFRLTQPSALTTAGWRVHHVLATEWLDRPDVIINRLVAVTAH